MLAYDLDVPIKSHARNRHLGDITATDQILRPAPRRDGMTAVWCSGRDLWDRRQICRWGKTYRPLLASHSLAHTILRTDHYATGIVAHGFGQQRTWGDAGSALPSGCSPPAAASRLASPAPPLRKRFKRVCRSPLKHLEWRRKLNRYLAPPLYCSKEVYCASECCRAVIEVGSYSLYIHSQTCESPLAG
jgi:hypothetical protein